jgi:hypothetical protein
MLGCDMSAWARSDFLGLEAWGQWPFFCCWEDKGLMLMGDSVWLDPMLSSSPSTCGCVQQANLTLRLGTWEGGLALFCCCWGLWSPKGLGVFTVRARSFRADSCMGTGFTGADAAVSAAPWADAKGLLRAGFSMVCSDSMASSAAGTATSAIVQQQLRIRLQLSIS